MKKLRKIYFKLFPTYRVLRTVFVTYEVADEMIKLSEGKPENEQWVLAKEEDTNHLIGFVYLCKKERIF
jgi:hypothetical protein